MSTAKAVRVEIRKLPRGKVFTIARFLKHGGRGAVDHALSRMVASGEIMRVARGVFVRPEISPLFGPVPPRDRDVIKTIARRNGETLQVHGAEAVRMFRLSTQTPLEPIYHTSGTTRRLPIGEKYGVRFFHTSNRRLLQFAGEMAGAAISALWYLGKENLTPDAVARISETLRPEDFAKLRKADMPTWMTTAFRLADTSGAGAGRPVNERNAYYG